MKKFFKNIFSTIRYCPKCFADWPPKPWDRGCQKGCFLVKIRFKLWSATFDWINIFEKFFHSVHKLRFRYYCKKMFFISQIMKKLNFFFFLFHLHFQIFLNFFLNEIVPLKNIFSTRIKSLFNSKAITSYQHLKINWQLIWNTL